MNMMINILTTATAYNGIYTQLGLKESFASSASLLESLVGIASNHGIVLAPVQSAKATATTTQVNGGGSIYGRLSMMINGDSDQCRNVSNDIKDNIMPYAEDLINNFGKEPRWMVKPYTSEELYPIKQNIVSIINILKQNIDNLSNSCINTDKLKTELESANDQNVLEMTNMLNNLTILLRQTE